MPSIPKPLELKTTVRQRYNRKPIDVTEEDIHKAVVAHSGACVNAEAIKRCLPGVKNVSVDLATIRFTEKKTGDRYTFLTPRAAQLGVVQWDQGTKPQPFQFKLKAPIQIRPRSIIRRKTARIGQEKMGPKEAETRGTKAPVVIGGPPIVKAGLGYIRRFGLRSLPSGTPGGQMSISKETT